MPRMPPAEREAVAARPLVATVIQWLRDEITEGSVKAGDKLPSEAEMARHHSVSRAVVREAVAVLRSEGLLNVRRGVGAFVTDRQHEPSPFADLSIERIASVIELVELRIGCEPEAAALAAQRCSGAQIEALLDAHRRIGEALAAGVSTRNADYTLHLRIAEATQNRRFIDLMLLSRAGMVGTGPDPRAEPSASLMPANSNLQEEHGRIVNAIVRGNAEEARAAMRCHLEGSRDRYRNLLLSRMQQ